jgi:hypothetical protein
VQLTAIIAPADMLVPAGGSSPDPTFAAAAEAGLVWLPERGMGWLHVDEAPYDAAYFEKYRGYAVTDMGAAITAARIELVRRYCGPCAALVDVGIGSGDFLEALVMDGFTRAGGYDVNPAGIEWLRRRGWYVDPYERPVDALTLWDALEHIPEAARLLAGVRQWVFVSLPIVPGDGPPPADWKHLRRDEHCWYWTRRGLLWWMGEQGFECIEHGTPESLLGREDIETFVFRRMGEEAA